MSRTQRAVLGWRLAASAAAILLVLALSAADAEPAAAPGARAAATQPAGTWRWEGEFKRKSSRDPGGTIQFYGGPTEPLDNGHGKFRLGGISSIMWGTCRRNGRRRHTSVDFYARDYTTVKLGAKRRFAFRRRSPRASSGPGRFRITGTLGAGAKTVHGTVRGRQRQVLHAKCRAHGRFTAKRKEQVG
jgi:hypothetical protein